MKKNSTFDAKNNLSALIAAANRGEPQIITNNGTETAVIISYSDYQKLSARKDNFADFLLNSPLRDSDIDLTRSKDPADRKILDFELDKVK